MKQEPTENKIYFKSYYAILVSYVEIYYSGNVAMEINLMLSLATKSTYIYLLIWLLEHSWANQKAHPHGTQKMTFRM